MAEIEADEVGASLKFATAKVERATERSHSDRIQSRERQAERGDINDPPPFDLEPTLAIGERPGPGLTDLGLPRLDMSTVQTVALGAVSVTDALLITLPFLLLPDGRLRSRRWRLVVAAAAVGGGHVRGRRHHHRAAPATALRVGSGRPNAAAIQPFPWVDLSVRIRTIDLGTCLITRRALPRMGSGLRRDCCVSSHQDSAPSGKGGGRFAALQPSSLQRCGPILVLRPGIGKCGG